MSEHCQYSSPDWARHRVSFVGGTRYKVRLAAWRAPSTHLGHTPRAHDLLEQNPTKPKLIHHTMTDTNPRTCSPSFASLSNANSAGAAEITTASAASASNNSDWLVAPITNGSDTLPEGCLPKDGPGGDVLHIHAHPTQVIIWPCVCETPESEQLTGKLGGSHRHTTTSPWTAIIDTALKSLDGSSFDVKSQNEGVLPASFSLRQDPDPSKPPIGFHAEYTPGDHRTRASLSYTMDSNGSPRADGQCSFYIPAWAHTGNCKS